MEKKIKILHLITRLDKGGSAENTLIICRMLNPGKYIIRLAFGNSTLNENELKDIPSVLIDSLCRNISPIKDFIAFWKIFKLIREEKPDIIHTHSSKAGFLGRWAAFLINQKSKIKNQKLIKVIHTPHGHVFYGYSGKIRSCLYIFLEKITAPITDKLTALTEGEKNESLQFGVGKLKQWKIIHSGVEKSSESGVKSSELKKELNILENTIVIGTVARLEPIKGVKYLIEAAKLLTTYDLPALPHQSGSGPSSQDGRFPACLLIVGDGSEKKSLESKVEKLGLKNSITFTGMRDDIPDIMSIMDIYIQPSVNEGMGKTIVQAMLLGKPIIASRVQGIPDLIKDDETGILVPSKNPEAIAAAVKKLTLDEYLRKRLGAQGKIFINESIDGHPRFSTERMICLLEKLYDEVLIKSLKV